MDLKDKVAIVTGGGSGIGEHTAKLFAQNGAKVVVSDINEEGGKRVVTEIEKNGGHALFVKADTANHQDSKNTVEQTLDKYGQLDIAVNNAGVGGPQSKIGETDIDEWNKVIDINLNGVFYGMRYQIPVMQKNNGGSIINMASILGQVGFATSAGYVSAKHGVIGLTKNGALEYAAEGIRINAVGPGFVRTPLIDENLPKEQQEQLVQLHPIGRLGKPEEIAELCLWLASDKSTFVNGAYYPIDGGYLAQ
jgi:NAD(P)-dependent dehydrogenase (short-subunit alcohol dehydrogenase family)